MQYNGGAVVKTRGAPGDEGHVLTAERQARRCCDVSIIREKIQKVRGLSDIAYTYTERLQAYAER